MSEKYYKCHEQNEVFRRELAQLRQKLGESSKKIKNEMHHVNRSFQARITDNTLKVPSENEILYPSSIGSKSFGLYSVFNLTETKSFSSAKAEDKRILSPANLSENSTRRFLKARIIRPKEEFRMKQSTF